MIARESLRGGEKLLELVHKLIAWYSKGKSKFHKVERRWTLPNGATLTFEQLGDSRSQDKLQGADLTFLLVDDAGLIDQTLIRRVTTNLRTTVQGLLPQLIVTLNPGDKYSAAWAPLVRSAPRGAPSPITSPDWAGQRWLVAHSNIYDNASLTATQRDTYIKLLKADAYGREHLEQQQIYGSWDAAGGGFFAGIDLGKCRLPDAHPAMASSALWDGQIPYPIPGKDLYLSMDWGGTAPTWCGLFWQPRATLIVDQTRIAGNSLILLDEFHTAMELPSGELDCSRGTGLATTRDVAAGVGLMARRWGLHLSAVPLSNRILDSAAFAVTGHAGGTIADELARAGLVMNPGPKGSRVGGWNLLAQGFAQAGSGAAGFYATTRCRYFWSSMLTCTPSPRDPGDLVGADHALDSSRYLALTLAAGTGWRMGPRWR